MENQEELRCLEESEVCNGIVEWRSTPDRKDFKSFPRCEYHYEKRLESAEEAISAGYTSDLEPSWYDYMNAGEHWSDDY